MHYSLIYFGKELYMFQTDLLSIIRSLNTVFTAIGICHTSYVDCLLARSWRLGLMRVIQKISFYISEVSELEV